MMIRLSAMLCCLALFIFSLPGPALATAQPISPILANGLLLGGSQAGAWVDAATTAAQIQGGERYRLYHFTQALGSALGSKPQTIAGVPACDTPQRITLSPLPDGRDPFIAVAGTWAVLPRVPQELSPLSRVYRQAVAKLLHAHGIAEPQVSITRIVRIDLEGDGIDEVLINATRHAQGFTQVESGDYSVVVLRKLIEGKVVTLPLAETYFTGSGYSPQQAVEHHLIAVLDLNGDGRLEPVVGTERFESSETAVYSVRGAAASVVLENGCGV